MRIVTPRQKKTERDSLVELAMKMFKGTLLAELPAGGGSGSKVKRLSSRTGSTLRGGLDAKLFNSDQLDLGI